MTFAQSLTDFLVTLALMSAAAGLGLVIALGFVRLVLRSP